MDRSPYRTVTTVATYNKRGQLLSKSRTVEIEESASVDDSRPFGFALPDEKDD